MITVIVRDYQVINLPHARIPGCRHDALGIPNSGRASIPGIDQDGFS
jgi:hypothetical protein